MTKKLYKEKYIGNCLLTGSAIILLLASLCGTVLENWWANPIWGSKNSEIIYSLTLIILFLLSASWMALKRNVALLYLVPITIVIGVVGIGPMATVVWYWGCATIIGAAILSLNRNFEEDTWNIRASGLGFTLIGLTVGIAAHFKINTPLMYFALISSVAVLAAWRIKRCKKCRSDLSLKSILVQKKYGNQSIILNSLIFVGVCIVLLASMVPDLGFDSYSTHLNVMATVLADMRWHFDVEKHTQAVIPMGAIWVLMPSYFFGGVETVKLLNATFIFAISWIAYRTLAPRIGVIYALSAPAIILTLPITVLFAITVFVEPLLTLLCLLCVAEVAGWEDNKNLSPVVLATFLGYLCATKLMGVMFVPIVMLAGVVAAHLQKKQYNYKTILCALFVFISIAVQPYLISYIKTGNPLFPFYNTLFKSPGFSVESFFNNGHGFLNPLYYHSLNLGYLWSSSLNSKIFGEFDFSGSVGIFLLVFIPQSIITAVTTRNWLALLGILGTLIYCALIFKSQAYLRYIYMVFPIFVLYGAWSLAKIKYSNIIFVPIIVVLCLINLVMLPTAYWGIAHFPLQSILNKNSNDDFLKKVKPIIHIGDVIRNLDSLKGKTVLLYGVEPLLSSFPAGTRTSSWHTWVAMDEINKTDNFSKYITDRAIDVIVHKIDDSTLHQTDIYNITETLFVENGIRVGVVKSKDLFQTENISGPILTPLSEKWLVNGAVIENNGVVVTSDKQISQLIDLKKNSKLLVKMSVSCTSGGSFRSQVNWVGKHGDLGTDIEVHQCKDDTTDVERLIVVPEGSTHAVVYGSSHTKSPVVLRKISVLTPY